MKSTLYFLAGVILAWSVQSLAMSKEQWRKERHEREARYEAHMAACREQARMLK